MRKLLFIIILFISLVFFLIASYNALAVQSKQRQLAPSDIEEISNTQFERLAASIRFKTTPEIDADINSKWKYWLKNAYSEINENQKIEIVQEYPNALIYKWLGRDPISKPLLFVADVEVEEPALETIPKWEYNPFMGKRTDTIVYGAGTRKAKANVMAWMESINRLSKEGFEPSRTTYWVISYGQDNAWEIAQSLQKNNIIPEFILAPQDASILTNKNSAMGLSNPMALLSTSQKNQLAVRLWSNTAAPIEAAIQKLKEDPNPLDLYASAPHQFMEYVEPEVGFGNRLWYANRGWLWLAPSQTTQAMEAVPEFNQMFKTTFVDAPIITENGVSEVLINFEMSPEQRPRDIIDHVWQRIDTVNVRLKIDEPFFVQMNIAPSTDAYGFEATHSSIKQIFPDVVVLPTVNPDYTIASAFQTLSPQLYHFSPLGQHPSDKSGINESIKREEYARMIQFYEQFIRNVSE